MNNYAVVLGDVVVNTIVWDGNLETWAPPEGCVVVLYMEGTQVGIGYTYDGAEFHAPELPPLTPAEVLAIQSAKLQALTQLANAQKSALTNRIGTINDAIELEMATPEEEAELPIRVLQLKAWKTYAVLLGRVTSQVGWPPEVTWPVQPAEGMDLTVSATAPQTV